MKTDRQADLKQCMPVRKCIRLEPTLRHGHVWHESTAIALREQPADSAGAVSPERLNDDTAVSRLAKFTT